MSTKQIRTVLHSNIDQIDDRFLRVLYVMTETYLKEQEDASLESAIDAIPPNEAWKPMTEEELSARLSASTEQINKGKYQSLEDLKKESEQW